MDTPDRARIPAPASAAAGPPPAGGGSSKCEDSPFFKFINSLSPIPPVKPVSTLQSGPLFKQSDFSSISSIFTSPHVNTKKESKLCIRETCTDLSSAAGSGLSPGTSNHFRLSECKNTANDNESVICSTKEVTAEPHKDPLLCSLASSIQLDLGSPDPNIKSCDTVPENLRPEVYNQAESSYHEKSGKVKRKNLFLSQSTLQANHSPTLIKNLATANDWDFTDSCNADGFAFDQLINGRENVADGNDQRSTVSENILFLGSEADAEKLQNQEMELEVLCTQNAFDHYANGKEKLVNGTYQTSTVSENIIFLRSDADVENLCNQEMQLEVLCTQNALSSPHVDCTGPAECIGDVYNSQISANSCQQGALYKGDNVMETVDEKSKGQLEADFEIYHQQRGIRRRCLTFDVRKGAGVSSHARSESDLQPFNDTSAECRSLSTPKSIPCAVSGIGLHLNSFGAAEQLKSPTYEVPATCVELINMPTNYAITPVPEQINQSNAVAIGNELVLYDGGIEYHDDDLLLLSAEGISQESPKKRRRKVGKGSEGDSCKRCSCKKSRCLKLYCECFAAGVYCSEPCSCQGCSNKQIHEEIVLATRKSIESRNPLAFAPKVIRTSLAGQEIGEDANNTPASARHKRGCNCKKSNCLKKYCECFQIGVGCSAGCRCDGCKNTFGKREGFFRLRAEEIECEAESIHAHPKEVKLRGNHDLSSTQVIEPLNSESLPITPSFVSCRSLTKKPPLRPCGAAVAHSSASYHYQAPLTSEMMFSPLEADMDPPNISNEESSCTVIKSSSPNSKRVSPSHKKDGPSPICKSGRKLILKSIPSFPSLSDVQNDHPSKMHPALNPSFSCG